MRQDDEYKDVSELFSPCFWVRKWKDSLALGPCAAVDSSFWDTASASYDDGFDERAQTTLNETVNLFRTNGILKPGIRALDIGCGTGTLALALAREGAAVTAVDFSEGMLGRLREKLSPELTAFVTPVRADWEEINLASRSWTEQFDLVVANMTPAMRNPEAFSRMQAASRQWCFLKGWTQRRTNSVLERLWPRVLDEPRTERPPEFLFQLSLLNAQGVFPSVSLEEIHWEKTAILADAVEYYVRFFSGISAQPEARLRETITAGLGEIAQDGVVRERNRGWTGSLLWRVG